MPEVILEKENKDTQNSKDNIRDKSTDLQQNILLEAINNTIQLDVDELLKEDRYNINNDETVLNKEIENKPEEIVEAFATPLRFSDWLVSMKSIDDKVEEKEFVKPLNSSKDLIDKFIASKPRKIDVTKEPLTPKELGRLSLVENEDFVTETLAGIYAKQGKYLKAIKIYEQLILNFPEKSTFFASRIRFLREKMEYDHH
jgi:tetratricopeptide (TPR) repeat protein